MQKNSTMRPSLTDFSKRLREFVEAAGIEKKALAAAGEIKPSTITAYFKGTSQPSADVVGAWVLHFKVNANWLLAGQGAMFLEDGLEQVAVQAAPQGVVDPVALRMETLVKLLKANGADEATIRRALVDLVRGPARYTPLAEPIAPYEAVQEDPATYGDPADTPPDTAAGSSD